jgi:hypothetical protein
MYLLRVHSGISEILLFFFSHFCATPDKSSWEFSRHSFWSAKVPREQLKKSAASDKVASRVSYGAHKLIEQRTRCINISLPGHLKPLDGMRGVKVLIKTSQLCLKEDDIWPNPRLYAAGILRRRALVDKLCRRRVPKVKSNPNFQLSTRATKRHPLYQGLKVIPINLQSGEFRAVEMESRSSRIESFILSLGRAHKKPLSSAS